MSLGVKPLAVEISTTVVGTEGVEGVASVLSVEVEAVVVVDTNVPKSRPESPQAATAAGRSGSAATNDRRDTLLTRHPARPAGTV